MTASRMFRSLSVALFAVCMGLTVLPGCGSSAPTKAESKDKKDEAKPSPNISDPNANPSPTPPPKSTLGEVEKAADQAATAFLRDLVSGNAKAEALSAKFVKVIGKPVELPSDKEKGYSTNSAESWLKNVGDGLQLGAEAKRQQAGDVVYLRGSISGHRLGKDASKTGGYSLRLVKEGGAWKVDWLSLSSAEITPGIPSLTPEGAAQEFAVLSFIETIADVNGMPTGNNERAPLIAAALTPELRAKWGPPLDADKPRGYDYNPGQISLAAKKISGGDTSSFSATRVGDTPEFIVVLTKPTGKKTYAVKLTNSGPNEWLVSEVSEKG